MNYTKVRSNPWIARGAPVINFRDGPPGESLKKTGAGLSGRRVLMFKNGFLLHTTLSDELAGRKALSDIEFPHAGKANTLVFIGQKRLIQENFAPKIIVATKNTVVLFASSVFYPGEPEMA